MQTHLVPQTACSPHCGTLPDPGPGRPRALWRHPAGREGLPSVPHSRTDWPQLCSRLTSESTFHVWEGSHDPFSIPAV